MKKIIIEINKRQFKTQRKKLTLLQLAELVFEDNFDPAAAYIGSLYDPATGQGEEITQPDAKISLTNGMVFDINIKPAA